MLIDRSRTFGTLLFSYLYLSLLPLSLHVLEKEDYHVIANKHVTDDDFRFRHFDFCRLMISVAFSEIPSAAEATLGSPSFLISFWFSTHDKCYLSGLVFANYFSHLAYVVSISSLGSCISASHAVT